MTMRVPTVDPCREPPNMTTGLRILRGETATTNEVRIPVAETTNADCMAVALNCPISAPGARLTQMPSLTYNAAVQRRDRAQRGTVRWNRLLYVISLRSKRSHSAEWTDTSRSRRSRTHSNHPALV